MPPSLARPSIMNAKKPAAIAILLAYGVGCGSSEEPSLPQCQGPVTVAVGPSTTPTITWTPRCRAGLLIVDPNSDIVDYWALRATADTNGLQPPIAYGASPNGSITIVQPFTLQAGATYRARLFRATGDTTQPFQGIGAALFSP